MKESCYSACFGETTAFLFYKICQYWICQLPLFKKGATVRDERKRLHYSVPKKENCQLWTGNSACFGEMAASLDDIRDDLSACFREREGNVGMVASPIYMEVPTVKEKGCSTVDINHWGQ